MDLGIMDDIKHLLSDEILNLILATPLARNLEQEDFIRWIHSTNGDFSIKFPHFSICKPYWISSPSLTNWKVLWKIKCPFKYKMIL